jgi:hypothetical protein
MCGKADHQNEIAVQSTGCQVECHPERLDLFDSESLSPTHERLEEGEHSIPGIRRLS